MEFRGASDKKLKSSVSDKVFSFAAIGDLHLGSSRLNNLFSEEKALDMQISCLKNAVENAKDEGLESVFLLGDVFDSKPSTAAMLGLLMFIYEEALIDTSPVFHIIPGNHDTLANGATTLDLLKFLTKQNPIKDKVKVYTAAKTNTFPIPVDFLPWPSTNPLGKSPRVCVGHFGIKGAVMDNGYVMQEKDDPGTVVKDDGNRWILGHLHTMQQIGNVYYPGTLYQTKFGENENKMWARVNIRRKGKHLEWKIDERKAERVFTLGTLAASERKYLKKLPKPTKNTVWRILCAPGMKMPDEFAKSREDVVEVRQTGMSNDMDDLDLNAAVKADGTDFFSPLLGLDEFLAGRGLSKKDVKRAKRLVKTAMKETGVS